VQHTRFIDPDAEFLVAPASEFGLYATVSRR